MDDGIMEHDAVVVGASLAGCTTALLLARAGAKVALVEARPDPEAYKKVCSHYVQGSAIPMLERTGLLDEILAAGGIRSAGRIWTRFGLLAPPRESAVRPGVNLRREKLDPLLRSLAASTPGVELVAGWRVDGLVRSADGAVSGVRAGEREVRARLVVGADGRDSKVAKLAAVRERRTPHGRFAYGAYYEGPAPQSAPDATIWLLDPDFAAAFPTDGGLTFYAAMPTKDRLAEFKADPAAALERFVAAVPDAPPIAESRRVSDVEGRIDMTNVWRDPVGPGLALVGDAALASDPLWGVGCGWAFQSAEWLAEAVAPALAGEEPLPRALRRYARTHRRRLGPHARMIHAYATGRKLDAGERLLFWAAARDAKVAELVGLFGTRARSPQAMLPRAIPRALAVRLRGDRPPLVQPRPSALA
jgi:flavin-dependent dehydrogenase